MPERIRCKAYADSGSGQSHFEDEALEAIWDLREQGADITVEVLARLGNTERLERMKKHGLFTEHDGRITLTESGESRARDIIRRHRLAERLFADVLDLKDYEQDACLIEHAITPGVEEAICTLLGHPPQCPHGKTIPKGACCSVFTNKIKPLTENLRDMDVGTEARIQFITVPAMDRLATMGLVPGAMVRLHQKRPSYVIDIDETTVAIDEDIARGIYVKRV